MTTPVVHSVLNRYPDVEIYFLTRKLFKPLVGHHERLIFIEPDLKGEHRGLIGLRRLYKTLKEYNFDAVVDLHDVLRSIILRLFFRLNGTRTFHIEKGRQEKQALTRRHNKLFVPLLSTHQRYATVFGKMGMPVALRVPEIKPELCDKGCKIGIAPFAAHLQKMWPIERSIELIDRLLEGPKTTVYLYGGGEKEVSALEKISQKSDRIINTASHDLPQQMKSMKELNLLLSMDSANMHIASNLGVPVLSIWGATHPYAGFKAFGQPSSRCIQRNDLECRPCSVFGDKTCWRGDWACLDIPVEQVHDKIMHMLNPHPGEDSD